MTRLRRLFASIGASYVRFALTSACSVAAVPIYLHYLGQEQYGLWLTLLSVLMPLSLVSLGFPTVSQNLLTEARAHDDWPTANRVLSSSFIFLCVAAISACLLVEIGLRLGIVQALLKTRPGHAAPVVPALLIALAGFALSQPLQVFRLAFRAFERVDLEQYGLAALSLANLILTVLALWAGAGIVGVAAVYAFLQVAAGVVFFAALTRQFKRLRFSARHFSFALARRMLPPGFHFFVVSVSGVLMWGIDNLVIAGALGVGFVTAFAIASRLTSLLRGAIALPFSTSGPTITALSAEGRLAPLRRLYFLSTRLAFSAAGIFAVELAFFGRDFIRLWAGRAVVVDGPTFMALVAVLVVNVLQQPAYAFIIATTRHRTFSWLSLLEGAANLGLSLWWVRRWGVLGVALGTLVPQALISGVYLLAAGARMNGFAFAGLSKANLRPLAFPAAASAAAGFLLRNFSATWLEWAVSTGVTLLVFAGTCWLASATPEERGILAAALRAA